MTNDGVGLPVRLHDLLLALAGRIDDDALAQARELLAVTELDRAVELVVGCLLAGRLPVTADERHQIASLLDELRSDPTLADRLPVVDAVPVPRHRFTVESDPTAGMAEVLDKAVSVLPDVRSVRCVWRCSPSGSTPGPLPQRVLLVDIGPQGLALATAYRIDSVLRGVGIRAAVEVLRADAQLGEYHTAAVTTAREVHFAEVAQVVSPGFANGSGEDSSVWFDGAESVRDQAPVVEPTPVPETVETGSQPETPRRARVDTYEGIQPFPPKPVKRIPVRELVVVEAEAVVAEPVEPPPVPAEVTTEMGPDDLAALRAALADPNGQPPAESPSVPPTVDAKLSDREQTLLQQLHEELGQREQNVPSGADSGRWQTDRPGEHQGTLRSMGGWPGSELVNGVPQHSNGHPPLPPAG